MKSQWAILEDNFPQSINTSVEWIKLRKGECSDLNMVSYEHDGVLQYANAPKASSEFLSKKFVPATQGALGANEASRVWMYNRWWRVSLTDGTRFRLEYTGLGEADQTAFNLDGYVDFRDDGDDEIRMIVPFESSSWVVLKENAGYVLSNANGDSSSFRLSPAYWGIGCSNPDSWFSNAVIGGNIATVWDGGGSHGRRHFLWNTRDGAEELSLTVRSLAEGQNANVRAEINWSQNLVIVGEVVYDLVKRRVYHFAGGEASFTSRPYYEVFFNPIIWSSIAFICTGDKGSFKATFQYGQIGEGLGKEISKTITINDRNKDEFYHEWKFDQPINTRVARLKIEEIDGCGITMIAALSALTSSIRATDFSS